MATTYLSRTPSSTTNQKTFTISVWIKKTNPTVGQWIIRATNSSGDAGGIYFNSSLNIVLNFEISGSNIVNLPTNRVFRDVSAWYHIVLAVDTTQATDTNRIKLYVNGVQETSFSSTLYPSQNDDLVINRNVPHFIGTDSTGGARLESIMSHFHLIDGTAYPASAFGETNAASGIWTPLASPSVTYGTNGFFLKFASSGALGTDSSGNSNTFTVNGPGTQTQDAPSNVFATMNPLATSSYITLSNGNLTATGNTGTDSGNSFCNYVPTTGKWYVEYKVTGINGNSAPAIGIRQEYPDGFQLKNTSTGMAGYATAYEASIRRDGQRFQNNGTGSWGTSYTTGDIISIALDCDNGAGYIAKNATYMNSGDPTSGASKTGAFVVWTQAQVNNFGQAFAVNNYSGSETQANFGNGYFGTTAVASGNADGAGYGIFEYAPPTGYYSLCTKNINTYG